MRKTTVIIFLIIISCLFFLRKVEASIYLAQTSGDIDKITEDLDCGQVNQQCCAAGIKTAKPSIQAPNLPLIQGFVDLIYSLVNSGSGLFDKLITNSEDLSNSWFQRPECYEGGVAIKNGSDCVCAKKEDYSIVVLCQGIGSKKELTDCISCIDHGFWTGIGCIDYKLENFIKDKVFGWGIGLAGMISLLCIIFAAFQLQTSVGNPEKIKKAQQLLTSCITGLILIIFSIFILRLIGVSILRIPGFN